VDLDLNNTRVLVRMRGRGDGRPKLIGVVVVSKR
jgi:hypothetical protein